MDLPKAKQQSQQKETHVDSHTHPNFLQKPRSILEVLAKPCLSALTKDSIYSYIDTKKCQDYVTPN
jgi:hypothetical protein